MLYIFRIYFYCYLFQFLDVSETFIKWKKTDHSKRTIYKLPVKWNLTYMSTDESEWKNHEASNHSKLNDPDVSNRVFQRTYKNYGYNNVSKGKPVCPIRHKWIFFICFLNGLINHLQPVSNKFRGSCCGINNKFQFGFKWKCSDST